MAASQKLGCVLVHGWAMNSAVWRSLLPHLPAWLDVTCVDLPGHGSMVDVNADTLDEMVRVLSAISHRPVLWLGWSMGGLAVLRLARLYPERVAGVFMVASNPCFVRRDDWPCAVDASVFDSFARILTDDAGATLKRFLALQVMGDRHALHTVRELQSAMNERGNASRHALEAGLGMLKHCDLRSDLQSLSCPIHWTLGGRDTLVPVSLAEELRLLNPAMDISIEAAAAHAPFLSHTENFVHVFNGFAGKIRAIKN